MRATLKQLLRSRAGLFGFVVVVVFVVVVLVFVFVFVFVVVLGLVLDGVVLAGAVEVVATGLVVALPADAVFEVSALSSESSADCRLDRAWASAI